MCRKKYEIEIGGGDGGLWKLKYGAWGSQEKFNWGDAEVRNIFSCPLVHI